MALANGTAHAIQPLVRDWAAAAVAEVDRLRSANADLLAACERLLTVLDSLSGYDFTISDDVDDAMDAAHATIRKAKGNSPA